MKISIHYFLVPFFYLLVALSGRMFTSTGTWYQDLMKPSFTPPGALIGVMWTLIYILTALSLIFFIHNAKNHHSLWPVIALYVVNGIVNAAWSYIFFSKHLLGFAVVDAGLIAITVLIMVIVVWPHSKLAALLLFPYLGWVSFAAYLTYVIFKMN